MRTASVSQVDAAAQQEKRWRERMDNLAMLLTHRVDEQQVRQMSTMFGFDYADLAGNDSRAKVTALVGEMERAGRVPQLIDMLNGVMQSELGAAIPADVKKLLASMAGKSQEELKASLGAGGAARFDIEYTYRILGSGDVIVDVHLVPSGALPPFLPRIGLSMELPANYENFTWYGRGPHENYRDRKASSAVGVYSGSVSEQLYPYIMPQESGNKTEVRWAALTDAAGAGLLVIGMPTLEVSAHHFTAQDLTVAQHTFDLQPRPEVILNLDYAQGGLGNGSCGPGVLEQHQLKAEEVRFQVRLRPLAAGDDPVVVAKRRIG